MSAYDILAARGATRLCHFTLFKSLTHIITSDDGVLASSSIRQDTKAVTDTARYDGELDYVCCSVQYPNSWFLQKTMQNNSDKIFNEWVVLYASLNILKYRNAKFCPCNASTDRGDYITSNVNDLFANPVKCKRVFYREPQMLQCCTTDGQAEILIKDSIPREYIIGIAVGTEDIAKRVYAMLKLYEMERLPLYVAPDVLTPAWNHLIKNGCRPDEIQCDWPEED